MIPATMIAYRCKPGQLKPVAETVNVPTPTSDQVLVKILAGGVCHTDLTLFDPEAGVHEAFARDKTNGFTMGHEGSGIVVSVGSAVLSTHPELTIGTYVAIYAVDACFESSCYNCSHGMPNHCPLQTYGVGADGSWATYMAVRATSAVPVPATPEQMPPGVVSTATDAVVTPYHAMKTCCRLQPEHIVLCIGVGGLGYNAIGIAKKCLGVRCVIACDTREAALQTANEVGADYVATPEDLSSVITANQLAVDFAFDFVGIQQTFDLCFSSIRCGGTIHTIGIGCKAIKFPPLVTMLMKEITFKTSYYGTRDELVEVLQAIGDGLLNPRVETRSMEEVVQVMEDLHNGKLSSRIALIPNVN